MANLTLTLKEIDLIIGGITSPREPHQGVFDMCSGDINVEYLGENWGTSDIETLIMNEYAFREMSFETIEEFQQYFTNIWNRGFYIMKQNVENAQKMTFQDQSENYTENTSATSTSTTNASGDSKFTNVPNQYNKDTDAGLTSRNMNTSEGTGTSSGSGERTFNSTKTGNPFEKWLAYSGQNRNIIYKFVDSFNPIFINTVTIQNFYRRYLDGYNK